jgi:hypothetical protein
MCSSEEYEALERHGDTLDGEGGDALRRRIVLRLVDVDGIASGDFGRRLVLLPTCCGVGVRTGLSGGGGCTSFSCSWFRRLPSMSRDKEVGRTDLKGELSADGRMSCGG